MGIIYGLIDPITKELRYIGQTKQKIECRLRYHKYLSKKDGHRSYLYNWLNSLYKKNCFAEILIIEENIQELDFWETFYIQYYKGIGCNLTNLAPGGQTRGGFKHTETHKQYLSALYKGRLPWNAGIKLTPSQKINHHTPENFINLSKESLEKRVLSQVKTKALKSKISDDVVRFIRENYPKYNQRQLANMFNVRQDYISDIINFKIRKYV